MFWNVEHIPHVGDIIRLTEAGVQKVRPQGFMAQIGAAVEVISVRRSEHPYMPQEIAVVDARWPDPETVPPVYILPLNDWEQYGEVVANKEASLPKLSWDVHVYIQNEDGTGPLLFLDSVEKMVETDSYENGCDPHSTQWPLNENVEQTFNNYKEMREWLIQTYGFPDNEYWIAFSEGRIMTSETEDADGDPVRSTDPIWPRFVAGEIDLYAADYNAHYHLETEDGDEYQPEEEETARLFGIDSYGRQNLRFQKFAWQPYPTYDMHVGEVFEIRDSDIIFKITQITTLRELYLQYKRAGKLDSFWNSSTIDDELARIINEIEENLDNPGLGDMPVAEVLDDENKVWWDTLEHLVPFAVKLFGGVASSLKITAYGNQSLRFPKFSWEIAVNDYGVQPGDVFRSEVGLICDVIQVTTFGQLAAEYLEAGDQDLLFDRADTWSYGEVDDRLSMVQAGEDTVASIPVIQYWVDDDKKWWDDLESFVQRCIKQKRDPQRGWVADYEWHPTIQASLKITAIEQGATVTLRDDIAPELKEQLQMSNLLEEPGRYYRVTEVKPDDMTWMVAHPEWGPGAFTARRADGMVLTLPLGLADQLFARYGSVRQAWEVEALPRGAAEPKFSIGERVRVNFPSGTRIGVIVKRTWDNMFDSWIYRIEQNDGVMWSQFENFVRAEDDSTPFPLRARAWQVEPDITVEIAKEKAERYVDYATGVGRISGGYTKTPSLEVDIMTGLNEYLEDQGREPVYVLKIRYGVSDESGHWAEDYMMVIGQHSGKIYTRDEIPQEFFD